MFSCILLARLIYLNIYERKYYILFIFLIISQTFLYFLFKLENVILMLYKYDFIIEIRIKGEVGAVKLV